jgi:putative ABC transport system permease protein
VESLRLALRGLRWRVGPSVAVFVVAVVAMAGAALGPMYAASASDSLVRDDLATSGAVTTGVVSRGNIAGQTQFSPEQLRTAVAQRAADPALDPWYLPGSMGLTVHDGTITDGSRLVGIAQVGWHRGQCGGITVVEGRCPADDREAMVSTRTEKDAGVPVGTMLRLGISSDSVADTVRVVGVYDAATADPSVWGLDRPAQYTPARIEGPPDRLDEVVVSEQTMLGTNGDVAAVSLRRIDPARVHLADLPDLRAAVVAATALDPTIDTAAPRTLSISGMPEHLDELQPQLDAVAAAAFAVTAQLVLLAWFVLFLVVAATSDERAGEIALAKLRGMSRRSTLGFGLAEPVLLVVVALPVGLLVAWLADTALARGYLVPGSSVSVTSAVVVALVVCFLGAVSAAALAARGILSAPVLEQLRRTGGRRARLLRSSAVDAAAVALAAAGIYELRSGGSDALALLAPGLIALAVGLLAVRLLPALARIEVSRTRASSKVASFLASRNVARRPGGLRIVVLLTLAVALAVFAVDGWTVAAANRGDVARAEVGASEVLHVQVASPGELLAAVDAADPSGTQALAAVMSDNGAGGLLAVDATRLGAVAAWDPVWVGSSRDTIGAQLHPAQPTEPLLVHGSLRLVADFTRTEGFSPLTFSVAVRAASGLPYLARIGILEPGSATYSVDLPPCRQTACALMSFTFTQPVGIPATVIAGEVGLQDATDAQGPVDLTSVGPTGWRSGSPTSPISSSSAAQVSSMADGVLTVKIAKAPIDDAAIEVADHPVALPVMQGSDQPVQGDTGPFAVTTGLDSRFTPATLESTGVLPRLLTSGTMADLRFAIDATTTGFDPLDYQVWLSPSASPEVRAAVGRLDVVSTETVAGREATLSRSGPALALRLFLLAAVVALVLGAGTLLANAYVVIRRRAYELAALRALGADRAVLVRSARREQVVLALTGTVLGAVAGLVAAWLALPALLSAGDTGLPVWLGPAWLPVVVLLVVVLAALVVVADIGARRTVRGAVPDLLRQVQE